MKSLLIALALASSTAFGATDAVRARLCAFWSYDFDINDYVCGSVGPYLELVERKDIEPALTKLEQQVLALEEKVQALEKKLREKEQSHTP